MKTKVSQSMVFSFSSGIFFFCNLDDLNRSIILSSNAIEKISELYRNTNSRFLKINISQLVVGLSSKSDIIHYADSLTYAYSERIKPGTKITEVIVVSDADIDEDVLTRVYVHALALLLAVL
jgi:hypothetical protein